MRLINANNYILREFPDDQVPNYVILSHTWGSEEVSLQDLQGGTGSSRLGFPKIRYCCAQAIRDGFEWAWVDTCCIDKTNSAELSEAINSMYKWYRNSSICYAYLADVPNLPDRPTVLSAFRNSRWFTRGWTLQELIAPPTVEFYNSTWVEIGTKSSLRDTISSVTGINIRVLQGDNALSEYSAAEKMSWASERRTTRAEDIAYRLIGIFDINMPMIYGEGNRAFKRLQEEIVKSKDDLSILAWTAPRVYPGYFARSPADFRYFRDHLDMLPQRGALSTFINPYHDISPAIVTSRGLKATLMLKSADDVPGSRGCLAVLYWIGDVPNRLPPGTSFLLPANAQVTVVCILIEQDPSHPTGFARISPERLIPVPVTEIPSFRWTPVYLQAGRSQEQDQGTPELDAVELHAYGATIPPIILGVYPLDQWRLEITPTDIARQLNPRHPQAGAVLVDGEPVGHILVFFGMYEGFPWCAIRTIPENIARAEFGTDQVVRGNLIAGEMASTASDRHTEPTGGGASAALRRTLDASNGRLKYRLQISFTPTLQDPPLITPGNN